MNRELESLGRLRVQAIVLLIVVFGLGVFVGVLLQRGRSEDTARTRSFEHRRSSHEPGPDRGDRADRPEPRDHGDGRPGGEPRGLPPELEQRLSLTVDQKERIEGIFAAARPRTEAILDEMMPQLRAVTDSVRAEVRSLLDPVQQAEFDRWQPPLRVGRDRHGPRRRPEGARSDDDSPEAERPARAPNGS